MADISGLTGLLTQKSNNIYSTLGGTNQTVDRPSSDTFDGIFNAAVNMISGTNDYLHEAQEAEVAFATGQLTNTHELAVIEQKANLSLQYTVAVKNAILAAYKEIMQIQV